MKKNKRSLNSFNEEFYLREKLINDYHLKQHLEKIKNRNSKSIKISKIRPIKNFNILYNNNQSILPEIKLNSNNRQTNIKYINCEELDENENINAEEQSKKKDFNIINEIPSYLKDYIYISNNEILKKDEHLSQIDYDEKSSIFYKNDYVIETENSPRNKKSLNKGKNLHKFNLIITENKNLTKKLKEDKSNTNIEIDIHNFRYYVNNLFFDSKNDIEYEKINNFEVILPPILMPKSIGYDK